MTIKRYPKKPPGPEPLEKFQTCETYSTKTWDLDNIGDLHITNEQDLVRIYVHHSEVPDLVDALRGLLAGREVEQ